MFKSLMEVLKILLVVLQNLVVRFEYFVMVSYDSVEFAERRF